MFTIAEASEKDIPVIIEIANEAWWPAYSAILPAVQIRYMLDVIYSRETLLQQIVTGEQKYLLLSDEHGSQAFASYGKRPEEPLVHKLHKLYVRPGKQQAGYGRALIMDIKVRIRRENLHTLDLNVNRFNPARGFYEKIGFVVIREEDIPIGPYWMNDFVMRLGF